MYKAPPNTIRPEATTYLNPPLEESVNIVSPFCRLCENTLSGVNLRFTPNFLLPVDFFYYYYYFAYQVFDQIDNKKKISLIKIDTNIMH